MYTLIIVEDEDNIRQGLTYLVPWEDFNFHVVGEFSNGREALSFIETNRVDAVLTDIRLPIMDGIELAQTIQLRRLDVIVVFLTGYRDFEYAQKAVKCGVKDFLIKPVKYKELALTFLNIRESLDARNKNQSESNILYDDRKGNTYYDRIIVTVKEYVSENIQSVTLEDASIAVNLSSGYLSRLFKEKTGMTFSEYVIKEKMKQAAILLKSTDYKTYEIADMVGYDSPRNFSRAFKQYYNMTPTEFRERGL
ncbi:MAG: response regulator [Firmicutes bacterium]|nr:response regulator [Bacillota bacterium]